MMMSKSSIHVCCLLLRAGHDKLIVNPCLLGKQWICCQTAFNTFIIIFAVYFLFILVIFVSNISSGAQRDNKPNLNDFLFYINLIISYSFKSLQTKSNTVDVLMGAAILFKSLQLRLPEPYHVVQGKLPTFTFVYHVVWSLPSCFRGDQVMCDCLTVREFKNQRKNRQNLNKNIKSLFYLYTHSITYSDQIKN